MKKVVAKSLCRKNKSKRQAEPVFPLTESLTSKSDFISIATHQLKTPLAGNKWALNFLLSGNAGALSTPQQDMMEKVYQSNERAIRLVDDMLRAAREESQIFALDPVSVEITGLVEKIIQELSPDAYKKNISISFTKASDVIPSIFADPEKMNYVFENLLGNAIRYTKNGGFIKIHASREDGMIVVSVSDSGVGIPKNDQTNIFKKFFRAVNARKAEGAGTGLGLFITKKIVEEHGGSIWFESVENRGTTFWVALPVVVGVK